MSSPAYTVSSTRLESLINAFFKEAKEKGDAAATQCGAVAFVFGELTPSTLENQRGQAITRYLLQAPSPVQNVAIVITPTKTVVLHTAEVAPPTLPSHTFESTIELARFQDAVRSALEGSGLKLGVAQKELEIQEGSFISPVVSFLKNCGTEMMEAAACFGELLFRKDDKAQASVEKAAGLANTIFRRYVKGLLERHVCSTRETLSIGELREELCDKLQRPDTIDGLESLNTSEFTIAAGLPACILNRSIYDPRIQVDAEELYQKCASQPLNADVLTVRYGTKHLGYTAFMARTILIESKAPEGAKKAYEFAFSVMDHLLTLLTPGKPLSSVFSETMSFATATDPVLAAYLQPNFGFNTGLVVLENRGSISPKATATVEDGMCFVVRVVLDKIKETRTEEGSEARIYHIELADTVMVRGGAVDLRTKAFRKVEEVLYEEDAEDDLDNEENTRKRDLSKITRQGVSGTIMVSREAQREEQLRQLLTELHAEFLAAGGKKGTQISTEEVSATEIGQLALGELHCADPPPSEANDFITINKANKVVWFPVYGKPCPFHASTISKVELKKEGDRFQFVVTFHTLQEANIAFRLNRTKAFLKELVYSASKDVFSEVQSTIQVLQQTIKNADAARKRGLVEAVGGKLITVPNPVRLPQIKMRPPIGVRRPNQGCVGNLDLHQNGLRFTYVAGTLSHIDIPFDNIKHVIFQPAVNSVMVCYHITLKKAVFGGKTPTTEIQFIAEVMESSEAATGVRRTYEEEIQAEEREEARVRETNKQFVAFARAVEERSKIRTQFPTTNFTFDGVHSKAMSTFKASRDVLWAVTDWPPFTLTVADVEVVSLERVIAGNNTFDMAFIMKDYNKPVVTINSVPRKSLEAIKDWCLSCRLYYMETSVNPNWRVALKDIREDSEWEPWQVGTGWSVLNNEDDDEEGEDYDSDDSDSTYNEEEDEETSSDESSSFLEDEESDISSASESDSGLDWEDLERKAKEQDRKFNYSDDDDEGRPKKRARLSSAPQRSAPSHPSGAVPRSTPVAHSGAVPPPRRF